MIEGDLSRALSAIYDSIRIVASAVVGAIIALAMRGSYRLDLRIGVVAAVAVGLAWFCSYESQRLDETEDYSRGSIAVVLIGAIVIAVVAFIVNLN